MALPVTIPNTFANATASIPLSQLDTNFNTLANAVNGISDGSETLANASVTVLTAGTVDINGGAIDGTTVGTSNAAAGSFTTLNTSGAVVFNDAGADVDFRVEGDTDANLLFVDASADKVGIGTNTVEQLLTLSAPFSSTPTGNIRIKKTGANATGGGSYIQFDTSATATDTDLNAKIEGIRTDAANGSSELIFKTTHASVSQEATTRLKITSIGSLITTPLTGASGAIFNEDGVDADFRIESDTNTHAFFLDGATSKIGINTSSPTFGSVEIGTDGVANGLAFFAGGSGTSFRIYRDSDIGYLSRGTSPAIAMNVDSQVIMGGGSTAGSAADVLTIAKDGGGSGVYLRVEDTSTSTAKAGIILERSGSAGLGDWRIQVDGGNLNFGTATDGATFTDLLTLSANTGVIDSQPSYDNTQSGSTLVVTSGGLIGRTSSSIKYKKDVETLNAELVDNAITNLRPVWYRTKDANGDDKETWSHIGLIAEEVHEVEPRLVRYRTEKVEQVDVEVEVTKTREVRPEGAGEEVEPIIEEYTETITEKQTVKTPLETPEPEDVDYGRLAVLCLAKIQQQEQTIAALEARIAALEGQ